MTGLHLNRSPLIFGTLSYASETGSTTRHECQAYIRQNPSSIVSKASTCHLAPTTSRPGLNTEEPSQHKKLAGPRVGRAASRAAGAWAPTCTKAQSSSKAAEMHDTVPNLTSFRRASLSGHDSATPGQKGGAEACHSTVRHLGSRGDPMSPGTAQRRTPRYGLQTFESLPACLRAAQRLQECPGGKDGLGSLSFLLMHLFACSPALSLSERGYRSSFASFSQSKRCACLGSIRKAPSGTSP